MMSASLSTVDRFTRTMSVIRPPEMKSSAGAEQVRLRRARAITPTNRPQFARPACETAPRPEPVERGHQSGGAGYRDRRTAPHWSAAPPRQSIAPDGSMGDPDLSRQNPEDL